MAIYKPPALVAAGGFEGIPGWADDDHAAAFAAFRASAARAVEVPPKTRALGVDGRAIRAVAHRALDLPAWPAREAARHFFERWFVPARVGAPGFVTAYYEPEVSASSAHAVDHPIPLYRRPPDLVDVDETNRPPGFDPNIRFARAGNPFTLYPDRPMIEAGALAGC